MYARASWRSRCSSLSIRFNQVRRLGGTMLRSVLLSSVLVLCALSVLAQERSYGRSMVITDGGIVATSHVLASQAGAQILARGGSAIDGAIAANAVLRVTEPMMNGISGQVV